jgi:hypothetical protein
MILLQLLSNVTLCFSKASDEPKALLFSFGASVLGEHCESLEGKFLTCKVYFRLFKALKTLGGAEEEETFVSNMIKKFDPTFFSKNIELKSTENKL